jgi:endoglucanase
MAAKKRAKKARVATAARSANTKRAAKVSRSRARAKSKPATSTNTTSRAVQAGSKVQGAALAAADRRAREAFLLEVTSLPTAAGREERVIAHIEAWVAERRDRLVLSRDRVGNLTIARHNFLESCAKGIKPLLITAHLDHPAFVVTGLRVVGKGKAAGVELDLEFRGGVNDPYFVGAALEVFDRAGCNSCEARIISLDAKTDPATKPFKTVVARLARPADAAIVVTGSIARWKFPKAEVKDGLAHTHACDDLAALAAALVAFDSISRDASCAHVALLFTRSEEIGFIGAIGAAREGTVPKGARLLCLENSRSFPSDSPIGAGPIVRVGDRLSVFTPELTNRVGDLAAAHAKEHSAFRYQRKLMPGGACEATAFASFGLASTCVCLPLGNYHNMQDIDGVAAGKSKARVGREFISTNDFHWLVELLEVVARKLDDPSVATSHRALMDTLWSRHARIVEANVRGA